MQPNQVVFAIDTQGDKAVFADGSFGAVNLPACAQYPLGFLRAVIATEIHQRFAAARGRAVDFD